jgi:peroxiredoxin
MQAWKNDYTKAKQINYKQKLDSFNLLFARQKSDIDSIYLSYLKENHQTPISLYVLNSYANFPYLDPSIILPLFEQLPVYLQLSFDGQILKNRLDIAQRIAIGKWAPEFVQPDTTGSMITLSSYKGKYLLLDFWASWCIPCRQEHPHLIELYKKYNQRGFQILSISLDKSEDRMKWLEAIRKDGLIWQQVSDLKGKSNEAAKLYGVEIIPFNFLIDQQGKIIAKNLRVAGLAEALDKIFNQDIIQ